MNMPITTNDEPGLTVALRAVLPDAVGREIYRPVQNAAKPATQPADPIRDMVVNTLRVAGTLTDGKSDAQLLADYTDLLRATAKTTETNAARARFDDEFAGYSLNDPTAAKPLEANAGRVRAEDDFASYSINSLIEASAPQHAANSGTDYDLNNP